MDERLLLLINGTSSPYLDVLMVSISGKLIWVPLFLALAYAFYKNFGSKNLLIILAMLGLGLLVTDYLNSQYLRPLIGRYRPCYILNPVYFDLRFPGGEGAGKYSFPSAHAANFWLVTFFTLYCFRDHLLNIGMMFNTMFICYSRVYLAAHYPGDILGGFLLAAVTSLCLIVVLKKRFQIKPVTKPVFTTYAALYISLVYVAVSLYAFSNLKDLF